MNPKIIFEDENFLVIDKPYGITVNNAETNSNQKTIQKWIDTRQNKGRTLVSTEFYEKSGIVHRLDKDTSGVLVIAKTESAYLNLKSQFQSRLAGKKYLALVHGIVDPAAGTINAPIERNPFNRMKFGIFPGGREAETRYKILTALKTFTLLEITPKTGRTHQIRVHMKYINHPIVSDPIYGGRKQNREDLKFCPRLFLHAQSLTIKHPITNELLTFTSPLPEELQKVLN
ncbi:MAG: RluA family pseudouridine synthase [Patescibacteria group bacterium]